MLSTRSLGLLSGLILAGGTLTTAHPPTMTPHAPSRSLAISVPQGARIGSPVNPDSTDALGFVMASPRASALASYALSVSQPGSANYRHFLTPATVEARFGPSPSVVAHDLSALRSMGYTQVHRDGWILYATAPVHTLDLTLHTSLRTATYHGNVIMAPVKSPIVPVGLEDIEWITGLTQTLDAVASPTSVRSTTQVVKVSSEVLRFHYYNSGDQLGNAVVIGPSILPTGLPATIQTTVRTWNGQPVTSTYGQTQYTLQGPAGVSLNVNTDGPGHEGHLVTTFTATQPGTYQLDLHYTPWGSTTVVQTLLPPITFTGSPAQPPDITPSLANQDLGASELVANAPNAPAHIAIFAEAPLSLEDLNTFEQLNHLTPIQVSTVNVDGGDSSSSPGSTELDLDLQAVAMTSPGASVLVYDAPWNYNQVDGMLDAMNTMVMQDQVSVMSLSYGQNETGNTLIDAFQQAVDEANAEGITIVASAGDHGDYGAAPSAFTGPSVPIPADIPEVTDVGGVDLRTNVGGGDLQTAYWGGDTFAAMSSASVLDFVTASGDKSNVMGGGGYSTMFPAPAWQTSVLPSGEQDRGSPDVAMPASQNYPGVLMIYAGTPGIFGGTSMGTPLLAGYLGDMSAQSGMRFGDINPLLYQNAQRPGLLTQATYGSNGVYTVTPGEWNPLTGLGTPNMAVLDQVLTTTPV